MNSPTKVVGRRVVAWLIDVILGFAVFFGLFIAFAEQFDSFFDQSFRFESENGEALLILNDSAYLLTGSDATTVNLISLAFWVMNLVVLQGLTGASIGKFIAGARVVRPDGSPCGVGRAALRWILWIVDGFPYFAPLVGFITALSSQGNRRVGDMAAGTYVVAASAAGRPVDVGGAGMGAGAGYQYQGPPPAQPMGVGQPAPDAQWDPARGAWIRWDGGAWQQHDPNVPGGWRPIS